VCVCGGGGLDWIHAAQDMVEYRALVVMVMNIRIPWKAGNFCN
jgi:hypothetical protein